MTDQDNILLTENMTPDEVLAGFVEMYAFAITKVSSYHQGFANGISFAQFILTGKKPDYLEIPKAGKYMNDEMVNEIVSLKDLLCECQKRFKLYEMDVDDTPPNHHIDFMKRVKAALGD